ncbi:hypothetical protein C3L33_20059, partial [Rhododendron williamsianum]
MSCFPCFSSQKSKDSDSREIPVAHATGPDDASPPPPVNGKQNPSVEVRNNKDEDNTVDTKTIAAHAFNFRELAGATKNFRQECLLGEGGFGRVYQGKLQPSGQVVAVKQLDRNGMQGNKEFLVEVLVLSLLHHPNLVKLVGYCADGDQRLLVYEYMPLGSVEDHLLGTSQDKKPLDWTARIKIASGAAQGLEYLHEKANPPVIYRDLKSSSILLDEEFNPRLSDYGLAKLGGNKMHVSPRVMGSYGYCAPEYERTGELTLKSDVYSFGVVLLELITGRRAIDTTRPTEEQNLVSWAQPFFRDPKRFPDLADPTLESKFPVKSLNQAVGVAAMCLQEEPSVRPLMSDVVAALSFLAVAARDEHALPVPNQPSQVEISSAPKSDHNHAEERDAVEPEEEHDNDSDSSSDGDGDGDHDDPFGSKSSSSDDGGSVEDQQEQDNSEKNQAQVKKSVKWASRCKSKGDCKDGSAHSIARHNSNTEPHVESPGQNLNSYSSLTRGSGSGKKVTKCGSGSKHSRKVKSEGGSVGSTSSSESSDSESEDGRSSNNSRSNRGMGPKYGSYGSSSRQDSDVGSRDGSLAFEVRIYSNADSQDGSVGLSSGRGSNAESRDGSLHSDSSGDCDSGHYDNVGAKHDEDGLS